MEDPSAAIAQEVRTIRVGLQRAEGCDGAILQEADITNAQVLQSVYCQGDRSHLRRLCHLADLYAQNLHRIPTAPKPEPENHFTGEALNALVAAAVRDAQVASGEVVAKMVNDAMREVKKSLMVRNVCLFICAATNKQLVESLCCIIAQATKTADAAQISTMVARMEKV